MTSERKAELRKLAEVISQKHSATAWGTQHYKAAIAACNAIPELLDELEALQLQLQEAEAENEGLRRDLGRVAPTEYRCRKAKGWLCGLGYGHTGSCMAVNHPHPLGSD